MVLLSQILTLSLNWLQLIDDFVYMFCMYMFIFYVYCIYLSIVYHFVYDQ